MTRTCDDRRAVHTIGHSTREIDAFTALLSAHAVERVVDVRRWPASRRHPHFGREALAAALASAGVDYVWRQDLGGYRTPVPESPNDGWRIAAFRGYADFMLTADGERSLAALEVAAAERRIAVMCAEAVPWRCHRQLLADALAVRGWTVRHILDDECAVHELTAFARPTGTRIVYPAAPRAEASRAGAVTAVRGPAAPRSAGKTVARSGAASPRSRRHRADPRSGSGA